MHLDNGVDFVIQFALEQLKENKIEFIKNEPMKNHTSFKIGGAADLFVLPKTEEQFLKAFVRFSMRDCASCRDAGI